MSIHFRHYNYKYMYTNASPKLFSFKINISKIQNYSETSSQRSNVMHIGFVHTLSGWSLKFYTQLRVRNNIWTKPWTPVDIRLSDELSSETILTAIVIALVEMSLAQNISYVCMYIYICIYFIVDNCVPGV